VSSKPRQRLKTLTAVGQQKEVSNLKRASK
jgi:hypothetical protein